MPDFRYKGKKVGGSNNIASDIFYDKTNSELESGTVQEAIDEMAEKVKEVFQLGSNVKSNLVTALQYSELGITEDKTWEEIFAILTAAYPAVSYPYVVYNINKQCNNCESNVVVNIGSYGTAIDDTISVSTQTITVNRSGSMYFYLDVKNYTGAGLKCNMSIYVNGTKKTGITIDANTTKVLTTTIALNSGDVIKFMNDGANADAIVLAGSYLRWES